MKKYIFLVYSRFLEILLLLIILVYPRSLCLLSTYSIPHSLTFSTLLPAITRYNLPFVFALPVFILSFLPFPPFAKTTHIMRST